MMMSAPQNNQAMEAMSVLAHAPSSPELGSAIDKAKASGVSIFAIFQAILAHAGDIQKIIQAILALIPAVTPPQPLP